MSNSVSLRDLGAGAGAGGVREPAPGDAAVLGIEAGVPFQVLRRTQQVLVGAPPCSPSPPRGRRGWKIILCVYVIIRGHH